MEKKKFVCIVCPRGCSVYVEEVNGEHVVRGNRCKKGEKYVLEQIICPKRVVTSTVKVEGGSQPVTSVKTSKGVPKDSIFDIMNIIKSVKVKSPCKEGDVILKNIDDTGADLVVTRRVD